MFKPNCQETRRLSACILRHSIPFLVATASVIGIAQSQDETELKQFAGSPLWHNLLYYVPSDGGHRSLVRPSDFFVNPVGHMSPLQELRSTVDLMTKQLEPSRDHPQCRYPARYVVLMRHFPLAEPVVCPGFESWLLANQVKALEIVYTSQFIGNPASVFGHAFVLAPSQHLSFGLWSTFNYAATIPEDINGFEYAVGGLTGWFEGEYSVLPFYQRLFQYGHIENRDLWRYPVRLSSDELSLALRHFWELVRGASFRYYFLDENCAGILLRTFAAILPEFRDDPDLPLYIHPIDLIKALHEAGRLDAPRFIPSQFNIVQDHLDRLPPEDQDLTYLVLDGERDLPTGASQAFLETLMEVLEYVKLQNTGKLQLEHETLERSVYAARAKMGIVPNAFASRPLTSDPPHRSHDSFAAQAGMSFISGEPALDLGLRFAIHDLMDRQPGYLSHSAIGVLDLTLSAAENRVWIQELTLLRLENYQPMHRLDHQSSWRVRLGLKENLLAESLNEPYFNVGGGYGASLGNDTALFYLMATGELNLGKREPLQPFYLGPELGFFFTTEPIRIFLAGRILLDPIGGTEIFEGKSGLRFALSDNWSVIQQNVWQRQADRDRPEQRYQLLLRTHF